MDAHGYVYIRGNSRADSCHVLTYRREFRVARLLEWAMREPLTVDGQLKVLALFVYIR